MSSLCQVPSANHFRWSNPMAAWLHSCWGVGVRQVISQTGLCKPISVMKFLPQQESLSLQRTRLIFETSKHVGVVYWIAVTKSDLKPIIHERTCFCSLSCQEGANNKCFWSQSRCEALVPCHGFAIIYPLWVWGATGEISLEKSRLRCWCRTRMRSGQNRVSLACRSLSESEFPGGVYCVLSVCSGNVSASFIPSSLSFFFFYKNSDCQKYGQ